MLARFDFTVRWPASCHGSASAPTPSSTFPAAHVVVDAKAPLSAFLEAHGRRRVRRRGRRAARRARDAQHAHRAFAGKDYWMAFTRCPELVVCFVPGRHSSRPPRRRPWPLEGAIARNVVLASPTRCLPCCAPSRHLAAGALGQNAKELLAVGHDLHARLCTLGGPWAWASHRRAPWTTTTLRRHARVAGPRHGPPDARAAPDERASARPRPASRSAHGRRAPRSSRTAG